MIVTLSRAAPLSREFRPGDSIFNLDLQLWRSTVRKGLGHPTSPYHGSEWCLSSKMLAEAAIGNGTLVCFASDPILKLVNENNRENASPLLKKKDGSSLPVSYHPKPLHYEVEWPSPLLSSR